jgi:hypothetical protein
MGVGAFVVGCLSVDSTAAYHHSRGAALWWYEWELERQGMVPRPRTRESSSRWGATELWGQFVVSHHITNSTYGSCWFLARVLHSSPYSGVGAH